jgi:hypothetical protein
VVGRRIATRLVDDATQRLLLGRGRELGGAAAQPLARGSAPPLRQPRSGRGTRLHGQARNCLCPQPPRPSAVRGISSRLTPISRPSLARIQSTERWCSHPRPEQDDKTVYQSDPHWILPVRLDSSALGGRGLLASTQPPPFRQMICGKRSTSGSLSIRTSSPVKKPNSQGE